jgi:hypothetical protein
MNKCLVATVNSNATPTYQIHSYDFNISLLLFIADANLLVHPFSWTGYSTSFMELWLSSAKKVTTEHYSEPTKSSSYPHFVTLLSVSYYPPI